MIRGRRILLIAALVLGGCTGLQQFPDSSADYGTVLPTLDPYYDAALTEIYDSTKSDADRKDIRNELIERRLAVVDAYFADFVSGLAKESATAGFGVALVGVGVGGTGSLVSESASQILSAVSAGLVGAKAAYDKTVLYEKTISALIAQMHASRKAIAVQIFSRWGKGIDDYPLWMARRDLEAYEFAGSIPGAIMGTAADAKVKDDQAEAILEQILPPIQPEALTASAQKLRKEILAAIDGLNAEKAQALMTLIKEADADLKAFADAQYPPATRAGDAATGTIARNLLGRMFSDSANSLEDINKWQAAIDSLGS